MGFNTAQPVSWIVRTKLLQHLEVIALLPDEWRNTVKLCNTAPLALPKPESDVLPQCNCSWARGWGQGWGGDVREIPNTQALFQGTEAVDGHGLFKPLPRSTLQPLIFREASSCSAHHNLSEQMPGRCWRWPWPCSAMRGSGCSWETSSSREAGHTCFSTLVCSLLISLCRGDGLRESRLLVTTPPPGGRK